MSEPPDAPVPALRLPLVPLDEYPEKLRTFLADLVSSGIARQVGEFNVVRTLANHPDLAVAYMTFGIHVLGRSSLTPRVREVATLRAAWLSDSDYEWSKHAGPGRRAGLTPEELQATKVGSEAPLWSDLDRAVLRAVEQLLAGRTIDDDVWETLSRYLDRRQLLDLVFTIGSYLMLATALRALQVPDE